MIDQVASVAEAFLTIIDNYDIEKELSNKVACDIKDNIERMAS